MPWTASMARTTSSRTGSPPHWRSGRSPLPALFRGPGRAFAGCRGRPVPAESLLVDVAAGARLLGAALQQFIGGVSDFREGESAGGEHLDLRHALAGIADVDDVFDIEAPLA